MDEAEIQRLAKAGEIVRAIVLYREIHPVGLAAAREAVFRLAGLPMDPPPAPVGLSPGTNDRLEALFSGPDLNEARRLLIHECGSNLPFCKNNDEQGLERIRFAALKLSGGNLLELQDAIKLAQVDWRDLLVAAEFANDVSAHKCWFPSDAAPGST